MPTEAAAMPAVTGSIANRKTMMNKAIPPEVTPAIAGETTPTMTRWVFSSADKATLLFCLT
jgi:hypothetical protein